MKQLFISHSFRFSEYAAKTILNLPPESWKHVSRHWDLQGIERGTRIYHVISPRYRPTARELKLIRVRLS